MIKIPGGDRTGPVGIGPRTGRGLGFCNGYDRPGFRRFARYDDRPIKDKLKEELKILEDEEKRIQHEKEEIKKRLDI